MSPLKLIYYLVRGNAYSRPLWHTVAIVDFGEIGPFTWDVHSANPVGRVNMQDAERIWNNEDS